MNKFSLTLVFSALTFSISAQAETLNCTAITTLPAVINTQGVYCFTGNLNTNLGSGAAIYINANNVVLDLNGFKLGGLAAGLGTQAIGIASYKAKNITIKNGTVRGFYYGIQLDDTSPFTDSEGHVIEDIRADQNTFVGINVEGSGNIIRNNQVVGTGGSTIALNSEAYGIQAFGPAARLLNNDVSEVAAQGNATAFGFFLTTASNSVVGGNRISNLTSGTGQRRGIILVNGTDIIVRDNSISGAQYGIYFNTFLGATGAYINNVVRGATTPYTDGTPAGSTNY